MTAFSTLHFTGVLEAYNYSQAKEIVDVGGGHGKIISEILKGNPGLHATLFDMPHAFEAQVPGRLPRRMSKKPIRRRAPPSASRKVTRLTGINRACQNREDPLGWFGRLTGPRPTTQDSSGGFGEHRQAVSYNRPSLLSQSSPEVLLSLIPER